ncbi:OmpH family outer membrane protein [Aquimarina celericrescens]|uniref:OmpH family outer membrane protein n=1 Tax=Aquimarina celericrescens TaxID=1964542 RepID=A0ABW5AUH6_9FLAO|nr:OmpH family outer membrane protein [Aquimarina celericrescens]
MNKLALPISILALITAVISFFYLQSSSELVYVDVNKLLDGYKRTRIVKAEFDEKAKTMKTNVDSLIVGWQNELKTYEKERSSMTKKEIELKQELLGNKQQQINNYQQAVQKQLVEEDKKVTQTVINDINDFVKEYGKKNGYKVIFGATGNGTIMYGEASADLTDKVLERLNAEFEGK